MVDKHGWLSGGRGRVVNRLSIHPLGGRSSDLGALAGASAFWANSFALWRMTDISFLNALLSASCDLNLFDFSSWKFARYFSFSGEMWKKVSSVKQVKRRWNFILYPRKKCLTGYQRKSIYLLRNIWYDVLHGKCVQMHYSSPREENIVE